MSGLRSPAVAREANEHAQRARATFIAGDALRGLAALGVFALHAASMSLQSTGHPLLIGQPYEAWGRIGGAILSAGGSGAYLFFALSGYLLSRPFLRAYVEGSPFPRPVRYVWRRVLRIFPAYWVVLTATLLFVDLPPSPTADVAEAYALSLQWSQSTLSAALGQAWTLNVEIRFYLLLPVAALVLVGIGRLAGRRLSPAARAWSVAVLAVATAVVTLQLSGGEAPFFSGGLLPALFAFMPGVALAAIELLPLRAPSPREVARAATAVAVVASAIWLLQLPLSLDGLFSGLLRQDLLMLLVLGGLLARQWAGGSPPRLLVNRATQWLGTRSYGFYLVHYPLLFVLAPALAMDDRYKQTFMVLLAVGFVASAAAAEALHRAVELPAMRLRDVRMGRKRSDAPLGAPEPPLPFGSQRRHDNASDQARVDRSHA